MNRPGVPLRSNALRLSFREWIFAVCILVVLCRLVPALWLRMEPLDAGTDYRIPYSMGYDYWLYDRYCGRVAGNRKTWIIGDSVMWGHYVDKEHTLSHYLNERYGDERFVNAAVDGIHPAAMLGLVTYYGRAMRGENIILHCNLLWMSSPRHDLQGKKEFAFNHAKLVPQFRPKIFCYRESVENRIGIVAGRYLPLFGWADHLRLAYFGNKSLPRWTLAHPYGSPVSEISLKLPDPNEPPAPPPVRKPWNEQGIGTYSPRWVELETSMQWRFFRETIDVLRSRGNRVFVVVGPFNEHMLQEESWKVYQERKDQVVEWLHANGIPCFAPAVLPSDVYGDASHPLSDGYDLMAAKLFEDASFSGFMRGDDNEN